MTMRLRRRRFISHLSSFGAEGFGLAGNVEWKIPRQAIRYINTGHIDQADPWPLHSQIQLDR